MMLRKLTVMMAVMVLVASVSNAQTPPPGWTPGLAWVELKDYDYMTTGPYAGSYRYVYDVWNDVLAYTFDHSLLFDATGVLNQFSYYQTEGVPNTNDLLQNWSPEPAGTPRTMSGTIDYSRWPSYWEDTNGDFIKDSWVQPTSGPNVEWAMDNEWHDGGDYLHNGLYIWRWGSATETGVHWSNRHGIMTMDLATYGLTQTYVLFHPSAKGVDNIEFKFHHDLIGAPDSYYGWVDGPLPIPVYPLGDFDHDYDVDDKDIDALCDFIRNGLPYDSLYDVSGPGEDGVPDSVVDMNDLDYHVHVLVETLLGNGTEYGDFNLDGLIDTTDLTRLATYYGSGDLKWEHGNANRHIDTNIDNTDLTILATYYGFVASPDAIPEPATMGLLAVGAAALLRRRRRA